MILLKLYHHNLNDLLTWLTHNVGVYQFERKYVEYRGTGWKLESFNIEIKTDKIGKILDVVWGLTLEDEKKELLATLRFSEYIFVKQ